MPRAKPKKEKLQVKEAKPVTRRGKMANESTAATVIVTRTSRRTAGKKLQEPEGDIESIVIDEEVSFRRASLGDQGFEDFEDNGKEGMTNGNVCVSPDIDQANNEPSLAGQSEKTVEGEKDVWATIVKTTRKDPRAQKLSYKKIPIVLKGDEKTDKGSQLPAESGNPLVNENSGGLFTGIRTYGRKRTSARKKNSNGDDESMDAMLSPKEKLPESNKVEESENRDVVERMSDVVVDKRTVEDTIGKDDTLERLAEDDWISEVGARPALSAEEASPENSSYKMMAEDRSGCSEKYDEDDTKSGELDDTLLVPDELTNNDDGILETGPPNGDGNEKESGPSGRRTGKKTNTESDSTKLIKKDAIPRMEDQTEEIHSLVSEVNTGPLDCAETARRSGRSRKFGKNAAREIVGAPSAKGIKENSEAHELEVNGPTDNAESTRKGAKSRRNKKKAANKVREVVPPVTEEQGEVNVSQEQESSQNGLAMDDGPTAFQEQTKGMDVQISEVDMALMNGVPSVDVRIVRKGGKKQRKKGKNTDKDEEIKATIGQEMVVVAEVECNPLTEAENVKKNGRARKKQPSDASTLPHKEEDKQEKTLVVGCPPEEDVRKSGRSRKNDKKRKEVVEETSEVRDEHDTEACQQEMVEVVQNGLAMDDGPTAFQEQTEGMDIQISEVDMALMNGVPSVDERIAKKSGKQRKKGKNTDKDEEIKATIGQEMVVVPEVECIPVTEAENVKKNGRARKKQPSNASTLQHKEEDKQEKALVMGLGCPPEEDVRKSGRSRKNDKKRKEVVEETSQVREEHDTEAWQQETEKIVASETTPPKSTEDVGKMGRTRPKRGRARDLSPVGAEMEEKTAGIDTDQRQKVRKSGRSRKTVGQQEELSVPADSVESQEDKNDIQEAVGVDESEGIAVKRGRRLPRSSVEAKKKRNNIEAYERLETDVKDPLEPAELENEKSFGKGVDDNNNNEVLKNVVIDVVETVERAVQEDTHCVDSEQNGKKNTRQTDYEELGHLMSAAGDVSLGAEKMMAETVMSTIGGSDTQTLKKGGRSRKKGGKAARKPTKSEFPVIVATEGVTSDGGVANEDTSEVVLPEVVTGNQEIPHDQLSSIVESEPDIPLDSLTDDQQRLAEKQQIKSEPITPLVQVLTLDIKNEIITPVAPLGSILSTVKDLKDEPITQNVPAQQQCVISVGDENLENEGILTNVPAQQLSQKPFSSDRVCDKEVERLTDVGLALDGNRKRRLMSEDEMSPAKALKPKEYQSGFWDIVDGETESECNVSSAFEVTADGLDLNGNDVTGPKGAVEVEADIHAEVDGTSATAKPPSDELCSLKSCNRLQGIIGSMATADCDNIDEIVVEDLLVQAGGRKRGGNRGKATKRKPDEEEVKEVRKSKRNKKFEEDGAEAGGSNSGEAKPGRCYKIGPSRKKDMYVGAHVSVSGGLHKAAANAVEVGARSFGLFLGSQRQWSVKPIPEEIVQKFRKACKEHNFPPHLILPHGSYLMNLGSPKPDLLQKSRDLLVKELSRCELLGLELFNFHPGSTAGETSVEDSILKIAESINIAHSKTKYCKTVIENMSCQGYTIGGKFSELRAIIDLVKNKSRIGVCLDTCHAMAAGYDLSTEEGFNRMMDDFTSIIGLDYLVGVHLNDSVGKVGCHKDLHENIGQGKIGRAGFRRIMNDARFQNLPMILETPANMDDVIEIKLLYMMCKNE